MRAQSRRTLRLALGTALAAALTLGIATPALGAGYIKFDGVEGEAREGHHGKKIKYHEWRYPPASVVACVEREMKESGEKAGTEDINIGVGELQECTAQAKNKGGNAETTWKVEKGEKAASTAGDRPRRAQGKKVKKLRKSKSGIMIVVLPAGHCTPGARYRSATFYTGEEGAKPRTLTNVRILGCTPVPAGDADDRPTEEVAFYYNKIS